MKRLVSFLCVISLLFTFPFLAFGQADINEINLTENQKNILRAYGLSEQEIEKIDINTIRETLRKGKVVDGQEYTKKPVENKNKLTADIKEQLDKKKLSQSQINRLGNLGYTYEEIANMEPALIEKLAGDATIMATIPPGYVGPIVVPGGGSNEYFHPDVDVEPADINWYVNASGQYAETHFNENNHDNMSYSYYLYGEWDNTYETHQGVDVNHTDGREVYNVTGTASNPGRVVHVIPATGYLDGAVLVYDDKLDETSVYLHIETSLVEVGDWVEAGDPIGHQSDSWHHTHFQAQDGEFNPDEDSIAPATYDELHTRIPYGFMTWYL